MALCPSRPVVTLRFIFSTPVLPDLPLSLPLPFKIVQSEPPGVPSESVVSTHVQTTDFSSPKGPSCICSVAELGSRSVDNTRTRCVQEGRTPHTSLSPILPLLPGQVGFGTIPQTLIGAVRWFPQSVPTTPTQTLRTPKDSFRRSSYDVIWF